MIMKGDARMLSVYEVQSPAGPDRIGEKKEVIEISLRKEVTIEKA